MPNYSMECYFLLVVYQTIEMENFKTCYVTCSLRTSFAECFLNYTDSTFISNNETLNILSTSYTHWHLLQ